ncbi:MAG TPA: VIT domain-containing protein, partial [Candidatus Wallbacteria bacterium]|nr:VIT domain-containing protein [Candidatus Wallbacteria bacterium]
MLLFLITAVVFQAGEARATGFIKIGDRSKVSEGKQVADVTLISETVDIKFDNQMSKTRVVQVFKNNTSRILEGQYIFPLPFGANIISFATWDDGVKINGVIMEKVKAKKIYDDIVSQMKDPGLLENIGSNTFSARIFPIPAYGTKRLEMEYVE